MAKGRSTQAKPPLPDLAGCCGWTLRWSGGQVGMPLCGLSLGRSRTCDLVLDHPEVSRQHARISLMGGTPWILDLGSSNNVLVNGEATTRRRLTEGDRIWLGPQPFEVATGEAQLVPALGEAWSRLTVDPAGALRDLAGADSCTFEPGHAPNFLWAGGSGTEEPGPLRQLLLNAALEHLS